MNVWGGSGITWCPSTSQISHFTNQGANLIRLPVGWQYLVGNNVASTSFDDAYIQKYDALVQGVLNTGAYALIDIHNYGRWNSGVVGSEISGQYFANIWSLLAAKYKNNPKVIFGEHF
jgi:aryl-phospho-beta-D-glucosidase BglC (GH1 family)